jgi:hypothetical protein
MTWYGEYDNGKLIGLYAAPQTNHVTVELADDHPDVVAYLNPETTPEAIAEADRLSTIRNDAQIAALLEQLRTTTLAQQDSYVDNNIASTNVTTLRNEVRVMFKRVIAVLSLMAKQI